MLTPEQIDRIYRIIDELGLNKDWVIVPLAGSQDSLEKVLPDGKVLVRAPNGSSFDGWMANLRRRLEALDLSRTARVSEKERYRAYGSPDTPAASGIKRYFHWKKP